VRPWAVYRPPWGALKLAVATTFKPVKTGGGCICAGIALMLRPAEESGIRNAPQSSRAGSRFECSRCAAFVMMVQATQLSYFDNASIDWRLRPSWFRSVFGQR